jgi:histone H3/H4
MVNLTARTSVKDIIKDSGIQNMSADFMDKLDAKVEKVILNAVKRAKENGRRTVMGKDV